MPNQSPPPIEDFKGNPVDVAKAAPMSPPQDVANRAPVTKNDK
jgi:hypothetical protein